MDKSILVLKFGGASVEHPEQFARIADIIIEKSQAFHVVIVVSAMGDTTNELLALARRVHPEPPLREQDMLVSVGERISIALLAMALQLKGYEAMSFTGSQSGIITSNAHSDARILVVKPHRILRALEAGKIAIVAGFQGMSQEGEITTLGRGGSDTTAVALAVALGAEGVEFFKDVPGIYTDDPKKNPHAQHYSVISYEEALALARGGAKILHARALELAAKNNIPLRVLSFHDPGCAENTATLVAGEIGKKTACLYEAS